MPKTPAIVLQPGQELHGFRVLAADPVAEVFAVVYRLEHLRSGARLLHVHCDDEENVFSVNFPTPPPDDSGMPHILEHCVLAGSQRFPVKEPFFEMVKMSMATFINAMTGYDCTYYPVSSNVRQDLFNLAEVYFDAVFHPLLDRATFQREAHHLAPADPADPDGALRLDGVVYSEMKGAFSDPEAILARHAIRSLLPDTCYGRESGGVPEAIPDLSYERLRAFHDTFYHPANAYICLYGDIPTADHLAFLAPRLAAFERRPVAPEIARQPRWQAPRSLIDHYPIGADEGADEKGYLLLSWLAGDAADPRDALRLHLLSLLLLGNEAAPLRRVLVDARIGGDLVMSGDNSAGCEATFHVGLKGSEAERLPAFRSLVDATLRTLAEGTIDPAQVQAAFQQAAYSTLEIQTLYPLHAVFRVVSGWIYGRDPLAFLRMGEHLQALRAEVAADPRFFNRLIRERLLDNPHRLDIVLAPDAGWQARDEAAQAARLDAVRAGLDAAACRAIAAEAAQLAADAGRPNTPEQVALLPQLAVADLAAAPRQTPSTPEPLPGGGTLLINDLFSNGVVYLQLAFDLTGLPAAWWPWLPRFVDALDKLGAAGVDYARIAGRISACTGGLSAGLHFDTHVADRSLRPTLRIGMKALVEQLDPALALLRDLLFDIDPHDVERLRDLTTQTRAQQRIGMVQDGQATAMLHAGRSLTASGHLAEFTGGLPQLRLSESLVSNFDRDCGTLTSRIVAIRNWLLNRQRLTVSFTGPEASRDRVRAALSSWLGAMRDAAPVARSTGFRPGGAPAWEGLAAPLQVAHCALVMPAPHLSDPSEPLLAVGAHLASMDYLLPEIRFKGNAYGAGISHHPLEGTLALSSYRDPHPTETLAVFLRLADYVRRVPWTQTDIDRGIIGVAKYDEQPLRPGQATRQALQRHLTGCTPAWRADRRARLLRATPDSVREALLATLETGLPRAAVCVMAGRDALQAVRPPPGAPRALRIKDVL